MADDRDDPDAPSRAPKGGTVVMQAVIRPQSGAKVDPVEESVASTMAIPIASGPSAPRSGVDRPPANAPVHTTKPSALAMVECPTCHVATPVARYCSDCGAPLVARRFCSECGAHLSPGAKFCEACGEKLP
jgi:hypothetical protein